MTDKDEFVQKCRYRECDNDSEYAYCRPLCQKLEASAKAQNIRNAAAREREVAVIYKD